ncbi:MAG TPA: FtsX-like permease family protein [Gaiellaceae bacterium]|nr:FtsX-like permease family protein [Gaiellaceae bacterium]
MRSVALRGLWGRKLRTVLTAFAIILGIATISGTFVLTDSITNAFHAIFTSIYRGTDASITGKSAVSVDATTDLPPFDESLLPKVRALPEVKAAIGGVADIANLIGKNGKVISFGGAPHLGFSVDPSQPRFNSLTLVDGKWPGANEVVIDRSTAHKKDIGVGDTIRIEAQGSAEPFKVSGLVRFGSSGLSIGGATLAGFDLKTAQRLFHKEGKLDQIRVSRKPGVTEPQLLSAIREILPPQTQVRTGAEQADTDAGDTNAFTSFLQTFLLSFGFIALFVGAFVIANSLSITIAQRTREFATLRTIGASRRQILRSVLLESFVIGSLASLTGLFLGLALAKFLFWLFDSLGFTLPTTGLPFKTRTIVVSLLAGILVTMVASLRPARRATRVPPIAAVREGATLPPGRFAKYRPVGSAALAVLGFVSLVYGVFGASGTGPVLAFMGIGAVLIFLGVALFSSQLIRPIAAVLGVPGDRLAGAPGVLARENATRNPQRTGSNAGALMIGLTLVTLVTMLATAIRASFFGAVDKIFIADYAVTAENNFDLIPSTIGDTLRRAQGVHDVVGVRSGEARFLNGKHQFTAVDPGGSHIFRLDWTQGSQAVLDRLGPNGAFTDKDYAKKHHLSVGSTVSVLVPSGQRRTFTIKGVFDPPPGGSPFGSLTISSATFDRLYTAPQDQFVFLDASGGVNPANDVKLDRILQGFPNAKVQDREEFKKNQASFLGNILNILYVLLALSVIVSLFGIVNTLVLTIFERTRELGMLRAVGMTRWQVRWMIGLESVVTALIGAVIGISLGIVLSVLLIVRVDFLVLSWPVASLLVFALVAIIAGLVAAIFPAQRAARLNVLQALQYE